MEICRDAPPLSFLFLSDQYHTLTDNGKKEQLFRPARLPAFFTRFQVELSAMIWKMASYLGCRCIWNFSGCNQGTMSWVFIWLSEFESSLGTDFSRPLVFGVRFSLWGQNQRDTWLLEKYCQTSNSVALSWISNRMGTGTNYWASWPLGTLC